MREGMGRKPCSHGYFGTDTCRVCLSAERDALEHQRDEARGKLEAAQELADSLPPLEWKPFDLYGDYADMPADKDGYSPSVDSTNQGDVHRHGYVVGQQATRERLDAILKESSE